MKTLLVIVSDIISDIIKKGEYPSRYYNPGNLFDEVHILMTNNDQPDITVVQKTVGDGKLYLHNLPYDRKLFIQTMGFRPSFLNHWAEPALRLASQINPDLIRCHGVHLNAFIANRIKQKLGIPYIISLHINPDEDIRARSTDWKDNLYYRLLETTQKKALQGADLVLPVYEPIIPYIQRMDVKQYEVAYNVLNLAGLSQKKDYGLHNPVRIISVGRQLKEKNPDNIIKALVKLTMAHLTLVGEGPCHDYLKSLTRRYEVDSRVTFHRAIPNEDLCRQMPDYDIFVVHTEYWEISKSVLEPLLTGLPVVINRRLGNPAPELQGDFVYMVENTADGYYQALNRLIADDKFREQLGRKAYTHANEHWAPSKTEAKFVDIYKRIMLNSKVSINCNS
jgi:glycosyltransferase involved in cell wall biosynthesis